MSKRVTTEELHNEIQELKEMMGVMMELIPTANQPRTPEVEEEPEVKMCPAHPGEPMYKRKGPYGTFWSHGKQVAEGRWVNCNNGSGWRMSKTEDKPF